MNNIERIVRAVGLIKKVPASEVYARVYQDGSGRVVRDNYGSEELYFNFGINGLEDAFIDWLGDQTNSRIWQ